MRVTRNGQHCVVTAARITVGMQPAAKVRRKCGGVRGKATIFMVHGYSLGAVLDYKAVLARSSVTQTIRVETPGCATASCELQNDRGRWHWHRRQARSRSRPRMRHCKFVAAPRTCAEHGGRARVVAPADGSVAWRWRRRRCRGGRHIRRHGVVFIPCWGSSSWRPVRQRRRRRADDGVTRCALTYRRRSTCR